MAGLSRQLKDHQLEPGQEESYYGRKRATIFQLWQQLEHPIDEVLDKYPDPDRAGYNSKRNVRLKQNAQSAIIQLTSVNNKLPHLVQEVLTRQNTLPLPTVTITKFEQVIIFRLI